METHYNLLFVEVKLSWERLFVEHVAMDISLQQNSFSHLQVKLPWKQLSTILCELKRHTTLVD